MFWIPLIMAGMSMAQGMKAQGDAEVAKLTDESNVRVANINRLANNKLAAAQGSLNRYMQSRQNQVHLKNTGKALETTQTNIIRLNEAATAGSASRRIAAAEESGAIAARVGAMGIGGSTVSMLNATAKLRQDIASSMANTQTKQQTYDLGLQKDAQKEMMILGLSDVQFLDGINMQAQQSRNIQVPSNGEIFANAAMTFMSSYAQLGGGKAATPQLNMQGQANPLVSNPAFVRNM